MSKEPSVTPLRRRAIVGGFLLLLVGAGFLNSVTKQQKVSSASGLRAAISMVDLSSGAFSSAWYCPGPLPFGHKGEHASIAITNLTSASLRAELAVAMNGRPVRSRRVGLPANGEQVVALFSAKHPTYGAVSVIVNGTGVGVNEVVSGANGIVSSPCTTHASRHVYFALGSTSGFSNMAISIYNPGATPAVASVSFQTSSGPAAPAALSSLPVEPEQDLVFFAGRYLPQRKAISASISTISGHIAVGSLDEKPVGATLDTSLVVGTPLARASWWFGPAVVGGGTEESFGLVNPTDRTVRVALSSDGYRSGGTETIVLAPFGATRYVPRSPGAATLAGASLRVVGKGSIVAERSIVVPGSLTLTSLRPLAELPASLPVGYGVTEGSAGPFSTWLVAGQSTASSSEVVTIDNTSETPAQALVYELVRGSRRLLRKIVVGPGSASSVNLHRFVKDKVALPLLIQASHPVVAGVTEYGLSGGSGELSFPAPLPVR